MVTKAVYNTSFEEIEFSDGGTIRISHTSASPTEVQILGVRKEGKAAFMCDIVANKDEVKQLAAALTELAEIMDDGGKNEQTDSV